MIERLLIAVALLVVGAVAYQTWKAYTLRAAGRQASSDPLLTDTQDDIPVVLYFTTPTCAPCQYAQRPALFKLKETLGDGVQVVQVDATEDPDAASRWKVQTVPTTFVLDGTREAVHVNHGVAYFEQLQQQLSSI